MSFAHLNQHQRYQIEKQLAEGKSAAVIARSLGIHRSTVYRELRRGQRRGRYCAETSHQRTLGRREKSAANHRQYPRELWQWVRGQLKQEWSPQQISNRLVRDFPTTPEMRVSTETIYQAIYVHARGELKRELGKQLRRGRSARKPHKHPDERRPRFVDPMKAISQRPAAAETRDVPGHWEGDLIIGAAGGSAIATLVERSSRYVMLAHLGRERGADAVRDSLIATVAQLPAALRETLTWDQGAEMAEHRAFSMATDMAVYFADPGAPWQRGSNENTNGLLRQYFPRGVDLSQHSAQDLRHVADELNGRPRKTLDWDTPAERLSALLNAS